MVLPLSAPPSPLYPPCVLPSLSLAIRPTSSKEETSGFIYTMDGEQQRVGSGWWLVGPNEGLCCGIE
jgi:hypothetical protein